MTFRLEIHARKDLGGVKTWEHVFDQGEVTIGRASSNDVALQDPQRVVSSHHAEIRRKTGACVLVDVGSTNGTSVNEQQLVPQREYPLREGDIIVIGQFTILFSLQARHTNGAAHRIDDEPRMAAQTGNADALVYELCRRYAELSRCSTEERDAELLNMLRQAATAQQRASDFGALMAKTRAGLAVRVGRAASGSASQAGTPHSLEPRQMAAEAAYRGLLTIAQRYCRNLPVAPSAEFITQLVRRLDRVLEITFSNLVESLRGRRQFAKELEVEASRILNWAPNQIKESENEQQVGAYLFDALSNCRAEEAVMADLHQVFRDLALHQIGLIKGFEESLRAVLTQLDPSSIERDVNVAAVRIGRLRLPAALRLLKKSAAWKHFKQKHRRFTEEEVRIFEQLLAPHFAKGYLDVQKTQRGH
jgi:type VI secretion system FHA domain protein